MLETMHLRQRINGEEERYVMGGYIAGNELTKFQYQCH